jgi:cell division protein ZapA
MADQEGKDKNNIKVSIMQREFTIACEEDETEGLIEAAAYLDKQMRTIAEGGQVLGMDRCAVIAGLNITHTLLQLQKQVGTQEDVDSRLEQLHDQVDKAVSGFQQPAN